MEEEIWKTVVYNGEVYDTIEVSNIGRMRNSKNGRIYKYYRGADNGRRGMGNSYL